MKTKQFLFTVALVAVTLVSGAVEKPKMNVIPLSDENALIAVANPSPAYFELSIEAENGDLVYYKQSDKELTDLRQIINFSNLENGVYTLKLDVKGTTVSRDFEISGSGIQVGDDYTRYPPYFDYSGEVLKLSYLNFDQNNFWLKIYNNGELVYENKLGKDFVVQAGFDLSKLEKGKYQVELASLNNYYTYDIEK